MDYYRDQLVRDRQNHLMREAQQHRAVRRARESASTQEVRRAGLVAWLGKVRTRLAWHRSPTSPVVADSTSCESVKV
jgi:hypothetical protein